MTIQMRIDFITSMIRENRIEHARLKKDLDKLLHDLRVETLATTLGYLEKQH